jgi:hypothetical protein
VFTGIFTKITISWDPQFVFDVSKKISGGSPFRVVTEETASDIRRLSLVWRQQNLPQRLSANMVSYYARSTVDSSDLERRRMAYSLD